MPAFLEILVNALLPVAVDAARKKIAAGQVTPQLPSPATIALSATTAGIIQSKTMWVAILIAVAGFLEQNQGLLTQYLGEQKMGIVMMVVAGVMAILRAVTGDSLATAGGLPAPEIAKPIVQPQQSNSI